MPVNIKYQVSKFLLLFYKARVLKAPQISYHSTSKAGRTVKPREGGWNLRDRKFIRSGNTLRYWVVVAFILEKERERERERDKREREEREKRRFNHAKHFVKDLINTS